MFKQSQDARYFFLLLDGRSIGEVLWNELKPKIGKFETEELAREAYDKWKTEDESWRN